jgi:hypothetical protein
MIALGCMAWFLENLATTRIATIPTKVSNEIVSDKLVAQYITTNNTPDWALLTEEFETAIAIDPENARNNAIELLQKNPPPFFGENIIAALEST